jgi:hypothetical protein
MSKERAKDELIQILEMQVIDLSVMSKIELGDDVIDKIRRLKAIINEQPKNIIQIDLSDCKNWNECAKVVELITSGKVKIKVNEQPR